MAEAQLVIVREILSACNTKDDKAVSKRVPSMLQVLSGNLRHADRRVRYATVASFCAMVKNYKGSMSSVDLEPFDAARSVLAENQNEGDLTNFDLLNAALIEMGYSQGEYMDAFIEPEYAEERSVSRIHGMILRLESVGKKKSVPTSINGAVLQMRMVLVAGVISASFRSEANESAEDDTCETIGRVFLSVKVAPGDKKFVDDLNNAIVEGTDKKFKLKNIDYWENKSNGKQSPGEETLEKSTEFAESEKNDEDGMYLDDDEKLAARVLGRKKKTWSMFNPSSALGLSSMFNTTDLEMIEYDEEEAAELIKRKQEENEMEEPAPKSISGFGLFRRLFG